MALFWAHFWRKGDNGNGLYAVLGHHILSLNLVQLFIRSCWRRNTKRLAWAPRAPRGTSSSGRHTFFTRATFQQGSWRCHLPRCSIFLPVGPCLENKPQRESICFHSARSAKDTNSIAAGLCQVTFPQADKETLKHHKQAQRVRPFQFRTWSNSAFFGEVQLSDMQEMCFMETLFKLSELTKSLSC